MAATLLLVSSMYPFGTGETFLANEVPYLAEAYDRVLIVAVGQEGAEPRPLPPNVEAIQVPYLLSRSEKAAALPLLRTPEVQDELRFVQKQYGIIPDRPGVATVLSAWYRAGKLAWLLRNLADRERGSEVHAYSYWANDSAVAVALARREGWVDRAFARAHGWDVYFERSEVGFLPFRRFLAEHLDHLLFVSEHGEAYFRETLGDPKLPSVDHHYLGTPSPPVPDDEPPVLPARLDPFTVVSCSSAIAPRRLDLLIEALGRVQGPVRWVHLGDGPELNRLREMARALPSHVVADLLGEVEHGQVLDLYHRLRPSLLINVSMFEGIPVSMMEAMSLGIPVLATAVGGVPEIVEPGRNGVLLPADPKPREIAEALEDFRSLSAETYRGLMSGARATWSTRFNADRNYPDFVNRVSRHSFAAL